MKKELLLFFAVCLANIFHAQNTFPSSGNVGIGTTSPSEKMEITGSIYMNSENNGLIVDYFGQKRVGFIKYAGREAGIWRTQGQDFEIGRTNTTSLPGTPDIIDMYLAGNGNVGIGTTNVNDANYKLFVETGMRTRKVKVDVATWADYVFSPSYKLPTLKEVEQFIKQYQHLPNVPSEAEVKKEGLDLGDNQAALLRKIEELTLYIIDQQKEIEKLKEENCRNGDLKKEIEIIKKLLSNQNHSEL
jgi:hypothetical protein